MIIGLIFQNYIGKKSPGSNIRAGWMKFIFFNLIIVTLLICFNYSVHFITIIYILISLGGILEIMHVTQKNNWKIRTTSIGFYLLVFCFFIGSSVYMKYHLHITILALVAVFDGFSQLGGKWIGKHKLAPQISPNKTWEGTIVGTITTISFGLGIYTLGNQEILNYLFFIPFLALSGDLIASLIKRKAKVKDFSNLIPFQGGFLDRFDSFTFSIVVIYIFTVLI